MANLYDTLLQYKFLEDQAVLEPLLAESMPEFSKDGLTVTIKIKKGILFSDDAAFKENAGKGRELKAQDFIYSFKRLAIPALQSQGSWVFEGKVEGFSDFEKNLKAAKPEDFQTAFSSPIAGMSAKDDYTLELKLIQPYPILNQVLAMYFTSPVPREAVEAYADTDGNLKDHPIGTGPFILKSWETHQKITLVKNPNFKGFYPSVSGSEKLKAAGFLADAGKALPLIDGIQFEIIKEDSARLAKFLKQELDSLLLTKDSFRSTMQNESTVKTDLSKAGIQEDHEDSLVMDYVGFNVLDPVLKNKFLRQAISAAIDRSKWLDSFQRFQASKQTEVSPPGVADRAEMKSIKYDFDLTRAKALMEKAGYPEGKGLPTLNFDFQGQDTQSTQLGEFFVQQLGAIGVKINPIPNSFPDYLEKVKQGKLQIFLSAWYFDYPDVESGYQLLYGPNRSPGPNDSNYSNPKFDEIYKKMATLPAGTQGRKESVKQLEEIVQEDVPWAYGYYLKEYRLHQPWLKNLRAAELIQNKYKYLRIQR